MHVLLFRFTHKKRKQSNPHPQTPISTAPAVTKSLNVNVSFTDVPILPPAAWARNLAKFISSAGLDSGWQLWKKNYDAVSTFTKLA